MSMPSPFSALTEGLARLGTGLKAPAWLGDEAQHRLVLFLNHMLMQEPEARARLARQQGRVVRLQWRDRHLQLAATAAGLCELAPVAEHDLLLTVTEPSPLGLARRALQGERLPVRVAGDVAFAAEVNWLVEHLRWDAEEDLARLIGDAPAHTLAGLAQDAARALREFAARLPGAGKARR